MQGQIFKIHSDYYYVNADGKVLECRLRDVLKKRGESMLVGDIVEIERTGAERGVIVGISGRKNSLPKPKVANVTGVVIVSAMKEPEPDFEQLDRYICLCEYHGLKPVLCFNKTDLAEDEESLAERIRGIYEPCGYKCIFMSARENNGGRELFEILRGKLSVFCGGSGVGKSTVINLLSSGELNLKTGEVSDKTGRGTHTTRHCEIFGIFENSYVVDTPGFSNMKFDFLMPTEVAKLYPELRGAKCRYSDCLHVSEDGCEVKEKGLFASPERYSGYLKFVEEAKGYKEKVTYSGRKVEDRSKINNDKVVAKISKNRRAVSRKTEKQNIKREEEF